MKDQLLIYGATGYMGQMLAEYVVREDEDDQAGWRARMPVILAARNEKRLAEVARGFGLPYRSFSLESPRERMERLERRREEPLRGAQARRGHRGRGVQQRRPIDTSPNAAIDSALADVRVVLNAAGPFGETALPLMLACLRTNTHYVDVCGEYDVLDLLDDDDKPGSSVIMPGAGLTVLASDLLIRRAVVRAQQLGMSEPHVVRVALSRVPFVSRGSVKTMLDSVRDGIRIQRNGFFEFPAVGALVRSFAFGVDADLERGKGYEADDLRVCTAMTLADLLTAGRTALETYRVAAGLPVVDAVAPGELPKPRSAPNVETYVEASSIERLAYEIGGELALALRTRPLKSLLERALDVLPEGPHPDERVQAGQQVVVEVEDRYRRGLHVRMALENSYDFTVRASMEAAHVVSQIDPDTLQKPLLVSPARVPGVEQLDRFLENYDIHLAYRGLRPDPEKLGEKPEQPASFSAL